MTLFDKLNKAQQRAYCSTSDSVLAMLGIGSGKSTVIGSMTYHDAVMFPDIDVVITANTYKQLHGATLNKVFQFWESENVKMDRDYVVGLKPPSHFKIVGSKLKKYDNTISFKNGHKIWFSSLENYSALDGFEFAKAYNDETKDADQKALEQVLSQRVRQKGLYEYNGDVIYSDKKLFKADGYRPLNQKIYVTTPPSPREKFLFNMFNIDKYKDEILAKVYNKGEYFIHEDINKCLIIASTFINEENLPDGWIDNQIELFSYSKSIIDKLIYANPFSATENAYYYNFDVRKHTAQNKLLDLPLHISIDYNSNPYMTCLVSQTEYSRDEKGTLIINKRFIKEYCLRPPNANIESVAYEIIKDFHDVLEKHSYYAYGDYSGLNTLQLKDAKNYYEIFFKIMAKYQNNYSNKIIVNPLHRRRILFANKVFAGKTPINISFDSSMKNTITDLITTQELNGSKFKEKKTDPETKKVYEVVGHCSDSFDYNICSEFSEYFKQIL